MQKINFFFFGGGGVFKTFAKDFFLMTYSSHPYYEKHITCIILQLRRHFFYFSYLSLFVRQFVLFLQSVLYGKLVLVYHNNLKALPWKTAIVCVYNYSLAVYSIDKIYRFSINNFLLLYHLTYHHSSSSGGSRKKSCQYRAQESSQKESLSIQIMH